MESIDLISFLRNYYGIVNKNLMVNKLTHLNVKTLFPNIERTSFDYLNDHMELVATGEIIMVYDCHKKVVPYINPHLLDIQEYNSYDAYEENKIIDIKGMDLNHYSKEELLTLRSHLKKNHQVYDARIINKTIRSKKDKEVINYKRKKKLIREDHYDKY